QAWPPASVVACRRQRARALRTVAARDIPRSRRAAEAVPRAVLLLCRRPRGDEIFAAGGADAAIPPRLELSAAGRRRQWRSYILGFAFAADCEAPGRLAVGRADRRQVRSRRGGARQ